MWQMGDRGHMAGTYRILWIRYNNKYNKWNAGFWPHTEELGFRDPCKHSSAIGLHDWSSGTITISMTLAWDCYEFHLQVVSCTIDTVPQQALYPLSKSWLWDSSFSSFLLFKLHLPGLNAETVLHEYSDTEEDYALHSHGKEVLTHHVPGQWGIEMDFTCK